MSSPKAGDWIGGSAQVNIYYGQSQAAELSSWYNFELRVTDNWGTRYIVPLRGWVPLYGLWSTYFSLDQSSLVLIPGITDGPLAFSSTPAILRMSNSLTPDVEFIDRPITWQGISFPIRCALSRSPSHSPCM
jgi:hypothetical protein